MPDVAGPDQALSRLTKLLEGAGQLSSVLEVVDRLFQRAPHLAKEIKDTVEEEGGNKTAKKRRLVELTVDKIGEICGDLDVSQGLGMPSKLSRYIDFIELLLMRLQKHNQLQWTVFQLEGYPAHHAEPHQVEELGYTLRTRLKAELKQAGLHSGVQTEVDGDRIWFRVTCTKWTRDRGVDDRKLEAAAPLYLAYYPGEPYFYTKSSAKEAVRAALVTVLGCAGARQLQLTGRDVGSLRRLRQGRDARDGPVRYASAAGDRFHIFDDNQSQEVTTAPSHPVLDKVHLTFSKPVPEIPGLKLDCRVDIVGSDVFSGLQDLVDEGVIANDPPPKWVTDLGTAGRNTFNLSEGTTGQERQLDNMSVLSRY